ncbi:MAG: HAMP domain-containing histidine kinase [Flavobacterium sp.]|nr:MAG: HAMP domain-containing histidine kinase [Flavobacterium sp.]
MRLLRLVLFLHFFFAVQGGFAFTNSSLSQEITPTEEKINMLLDKADKLKYEDNKLGISLAKEAEQLALTEKNERKLGEVFTAYGTLYYVNGTFDISLQMHLKALKIHEKYKNHYLTTRSLNGIGLVQMGLNQYAECIETFKKCIILNTKFKNFGAVGRNHFNISVAEIELKKFDEASKGLKKALKFAIQDKDVDTEHMIYSRLGEVKLFLNEIDSSLHYYKKLFNHPVEPSNWEKTYSYAGLANAYKKISRLDEAERYAILAYRYAKELNAKWDLERSTAILSAIYAEKKDMQNAYKYLSLHKVYNDSLFDQEKISEINYQQLKRKEAENLQLESEKEAALQKEKTSTIIIYSFVLLILFLLGILFLLKKNIRLKDRFNEELTQKNNDIENQRAIIASQNETLEGLNKSKNHLFSILSHDLKTPINSIFQVLELQQQGDLTKEVQQEIFEQLLKQVEGTSMMLNNLLHWANTQMDGTVVQLEDINLTEIVNTSIDSFYMEAFTKKITINNLSHQNQHFINADLGQTRIIVQNVLANAIKFTPVEGSVEVFYSESSHYQNLHIVDYGMGMSKNVVDEIINYDKRMSSEMGTAMEKGTGLGLLLVKQFLVNNKGTMDIKSEEGKGTEFIISFLKAK